MRLRARLTALACLVPACCVPPTPRPTPAPPPTRASPSPTLVATATPIARLATWRDAPATPGDWRYGPVDGGSLARFVSGGTPVFGVGCMAGTRRITLLRYGAPAAGSNAPMVVRTTSTDRALGVPPSNDGQSLSAALAASDPLLDAIAFSRGRFAVEAPGAAPLYLPSWPEVTRVIEDCR